MGPINNSLFIRTNISNDNIGFEEIFEIVLYYMPMIMTPLVYDQNFTPRKGVMTRYRLRDSSFEFYGKVIV